MIFLLLLAFFSSRKFMQENGGITASLNHIVVERSDGTADYYDSYEFDKAGRGSVVKASFQLPEKPDDGNYSMYTSVYNSIVTVRFQDRILFQYGEDAYKNGWQIGNVFVCADIPEDAWGNEVEFEYDNVDYSNIESVMPVEILHSSDRNFYLLNGSRAIYFLSVAFLICCGIAFLPLILWNRGGTVRNRGFVLILLIASTLIWSMGYQRLFFVTSDNSPLVCNLEYLGIFMTPFSFCLFMLETESGKRIRKILMIQFAVDFLVFAVCTILNFTTVNFHYCRFLLLVHTEIVLALTTVIVYFFTDRVVEDNYIKNFRIGTIVFSGFVAVDMVVYYLRVNGFVNSSVAFLPFGIFSYILILAFSYLNYILKFMIDFKDKERLQKLAYTDGMTGVSNRRACLDKINSLDAESSYGIVFVDVNDLKLANDKYSHDVGDRLIKFIADSLTESFGRECFIGRYGGDEFIICIRSSKNIKNEIDRKLNSFQNIINRVNERDIFPFEVSAAYGYALSSDNPEENAAGILGLADQQMYENKKAMKKERK